MSRPHTGKGVLTVRALGRGRRLLAAVLVVVLLSALVPAARALVSATITINGNFDDWPGVMTDPANALTDPIGAADPDNPGTANRDLNLVGFTYNTTNLYVYTRRTSTGSNALEYMIYIDRNNDGVMQSTDMVMDYSFNGAAYQASKSGLYRYNPSVSSGDAMVGDGARMPGSLGAAVSGASFAAAGGADGLETEGRVTWASLGIAAGSPIRLKWAISLNTNLPGSIQDNTGTLSLLLRSLTLLPDRDAGATAGGTVDYAHTLTNKGNTTETVDFTLTSSEKWTVSVRLTAGGPAVTSTVLGPGQAIPIIVRVVVPPSAISGEKDTTVLFARLASDPGVVATTRDVTTVGDLVVMPDQFGSMAPGGTMVFTNIVVNTSAATRTVSLSGASERGWAVGIFDASGVVPLGTISVGPNGRVDITVKVTVPGGAVIGTQDVTLVTAQDVNNPLVRGVGRDTLTVRPEIAVTPDYNDVGGAGTDVWYRHTITNSWTATRTLTLSATSSNGWGTVFYNAARTSQITTVAVGPYGGAIDAWVRIRVPSGVASGTVETTTVRATFGGTTGTATDRTTIKRLATYSNAGFTISSSAFRLGETVFARAMGLASGSSVKFRWIDSTNTTLRTSPALPVDTQGMCWDSYAIGPSANTGTWTLVLLTGADAEISRTTFTVSYDAQITELVAFDAIGLGSPLVAGATVANYGVAAISGSKIDYRVWWDANGNGAYDAGDTYIDSAGLPRARTGAPTDLTFTRSVGAVPVAGSWADPGWSVLNSSFPFAGTYQVTATWIGADGATIGAASTTCDVTLDARLTLTVSQSSVNFGVTDPGVPVIAAPYTVTVDSSTRYQLTTEYFGNAAQLGLATTVGDKPNEPPGVRAYSETASINVPWSTDPGIHNASVRYTVVQN